MSESTKFDWAIIDMDPLVYRCGFAVEKIDKETGILKVEPVHHAYYNVNSMIKKVLKHTKSGNYKGWLTGSGNFRFDIFPLYKANRKDARKPVHYAEIREFLQNKWKAEITTGQEADDQCSIDHCEFNKLGFDKDNYNSIVCSFDKDFNNIPGWHYNFVKDEIYYVDELEAYRNFYLQILTGDNSDGIPRIVKGWKKKNVELELKEALTAEAMEDIIISELKKLKKDNFMEEFVNRARLVWLRREKDEMWLPRGQHICQKQEARS